MDVDIAKANELNLKSFNKVSTKFFDYGTAGFRDKAKDLGFVLYRMGILAVIKSKAEKGHIVGLMITASHNPEEDNGVKLCGPSGEMLEKEWEGYATELINAKDEDFSAVLKKIYVTVNYDTPANVFLGRDTRPSSQLLLDNAIAGIKVLGGDFKDFGLVTTPMLHYFVASKNDPLYGESSIEGYYRKLSGAFETLKQYCNNGSKYDKLVFLDGANGIGALKIRELKPYLHSLEIQVFNDGSSGKLNYKCGADYVKVDQTFPEGIQLENGKRFVSFDGDADRVVYFYSDENGTFHLLDGDKIASLIAKYLKKLVEEIGMNYENRVIQTAYANGRSTSYIEKTLNIPVVCVPTGVKHLHHEAKKYDIGVYFEANGHGTVLFSKKVKDEVKALAEDSSAPEAQQKKANKFCRFIDIINETVGDAISDMLAVETILCEFDWNIQDWDALYSEYPCRQLKAKVPDRRVVMTTDADRKCTKPDGLQDAINSSVSKYPNGRAFVRPSGTEDVVRVYAEAETRELADSLAEEIRSLVMKFTG